MSTVSLQISIDINPGLKPNSVVCDFEQAIINAFQSKFSFIKIFGCLFHIIKKIRSEKYEFNLISNCRKDVNFPITVKMVLTLAFIKIIELYFIGYLHFFINYKLVRVPSKIINYLIYYFDLFIVT